MNICTLLEQRAAKHPDRIAVVHSGSTLTYKELLLMVQSQAARLSGKGITAGDRVLLFVPMSATLYVHLLAVLWLGATAAFVDPWMKRKALIGACNKVMPRGFIGVPKAHLLRLVSSSIRAAKTKQIVSTSKLPRITARVTLPIASVASDHPALITFTTGSTGIPKAGVRSHGFLLKQHEMLTKYLDTSEADVDLTILPIFVLHNLALGATSVIPSDVSKVAEVDVEEIAALLKNHQITTSTGSPAFFKRLAAAGLGSSLRAIHIGGAPCYPEDVMTIRAAMPKTKITIVYGSTEAELIAEIDAEDMLALHDAESLVAGKPINEVDLRIIRIHDGPIIAPRIDDIELKTGEIGEICVSGSHVMTEYLNSPEAFAANKIVIGDTVWHRTGDAGYLDANSVLYLVGRVEHRIETEGKTLYLLPAEQKLRSIAGVKEGTLSLAYGKLYAVLVADAVIPLETIQRSIPEVQQVCMLNAMPHDPRHNAKIDHAALKTILTKAT